MRKEIKDLPKEMQTAYKKLSDRPDENTPEVILDFFKDYSKNANNQFLINQIVDYTDDSLLDLELDEKLDDEFIYLTFATHVVGKITSTVDLDTKQSKSLKFYDDNPKIKRLRIKDFSKLGDLSDIEPLKRADVFAKHYKVDEDEEYLALSAWEKKLFADKVYTREKIAAEKK